MNAEELYEEMKDALRHFNINFHDKHLMTVEFKDGEVIFGYGNKSISIKADG
jgi:hypothetical protein